MRLALPLSLSTLTLGTALLIAPATSDVVSYNVDPVHSNVLFKIKHNGVSWFYARFGELSGHFSYDEGKPADSECLMVVKTASVDTRNDKLNGHLKSPDFFDATQFPEITFESTKVKKGKGDTLQVTGDLSLHGVTKSITVELEKVGSGDMRGKKMIGFHARFTIDRTDFGMNYGVGGPLGSEVELTISVEAAAG